MRFLCIQLLNRTWTAPYDYHVMLLPAANDFVVEKFAFDETCENRLFRLLPIETIISMDFLYISAKFGDNRSFSMLPFGS